MICPFRSFDNKNSKYYMSILLKLGSLYPFLCQCLTSYCNMNSDFRYASIRFDRIYIINVKCFVKCIYIEYMKSIEWLSVNNYDYMNSSIYMMNFIKLCNYYVIAARPKYREQYFKYRYNYSNTDGRYFDNKDSK